MWCTNFGRFSIFNILVFLIGNQKQFVSHPLPMFLGVMNETGSRTQFDGVATVCPWVRPSISMCPRPNCLCCSVWNVSSGRMMTRSCWPKLQEMGNRFGGSFGCDLHGLARFEWDPNFPKQTWAPPVDLFQLELLGGGTKNLVLFWRAVSIGIN